MKTASIPPLRVDPAVRDAAESVLHEGETLSSFVLESVCLNIERRRAQREFIERGLAALQRAVQTGHYVTVEQVTHKLAQRIAARRKAR